MNKDSVEILGFGVNSYNKEQALEYILENSGIVVTINPEMISYAKNHSDFANIIKNADLVIPDGIGIEIGLKILGNNIKRIPGIDFGLSLIKEVSKTGEGIAFIGAKPTIADKAVENLKKEIPNLNVVYCHDGYFKDEQAVINDICDSNPKLILAALGSPKQEFFINELKKRLPDAILIGLGGSFDVWSGQVQRAPKIYQKLGLEWLYRTIKEPQRIKRIFPTLPLFVLNVVKERCIK